MRRFTPDLLTLCSAASLLLCVATVVLWLWTRWRPLEIKWVAETQWPFSDADSGAGNGRTRYRFLASHGYLLFRRDWAVRPLPADTASTSQQIARQWRYISYGFHYSRWDDIALSSNKTPIGAPYGMHIHCSASFVWPVLLFTIFPILFGIRFWIRSVRRQKLVQACRCPQCGYDLRIQLALSKQSESNGRGSPQRCPECGTPTVTAAT